MGCFILAPQDPLPLAVLGGSPSDGMGRTEVGRGAVLSLLNNRENVGGREKGGADSLQRAPDLERGPVHTETCMLLVTGVLLVGRYPGAPF